jgi:hypothetical protein
MNIYICKKVYIFNLPEFKIGHAYTL